MTYAFVPPALKARRAFGFKMPAFFTQSAKEPRKRGERASKPAVDESKLLQAGRRGVAIIFLRNNNRRDVKDGRKANLKRIHREHL